MNAQTMERELSLALGELEGLLLSESTALKGLDRDALDAITDRKLALFTKLASITQRARPGGEEKARLERIKRLALANQLLLVHARDTVRGVLNLATGEQLPAPAYSIHPTGGGVRLNVKG
jgi:hypothetical protein